MSKSTNLKHTQNYLVGSVAIKALGFISIPFFTHYLSVEEYGLMSLYITVLSFLSTLFSLGVLGSFKRYYFEDNGDFGEFLYSNMIMLFVIDIIIMGILYYFIDDISILLKIPNDVLLYAMVVSVLLLIIKIKLDLLQITQRSKKNVFFEFIQNIVVLFFAIVFILYLPNNKYLGKIYADMLSYSFIALYALYQLSKIMKYKFDIKYLKYSLLFGLPVLPSMFSSFGLAFADRLMINNITNTTDVGLYSFAFMIAMLVQVIIGAVGKSWQPLFYKSLSEKNYDILDNTFLLNAKIVFSGSLFLILFSYEFIYMLSNQNYEDAQNVIIYLVIGYNFFFLYTIYGQYSSYAKKTYIDSIITFTAVFINIGLNYIFIPMYGYKASAITTIVSYATMFILFYITAKYILKYRVVSFFTPWKVYVSYILALFILLVIEQFSMDYIYLLFLKSCLIGMFLLFNFKDAVYRYLRVENE
jgi:O-antigen/teichoic acid export membrane protein